MKSSNESSGNLAEKIYLLRHKAIQKRKILSREQLNRPISFWIKEDRLRDEIGKEFTIIIRTNGCNWALSKKGGCSMCGYIQDASIQKVDDDMVINQFNNALENKLTVIEKDDNNYILKIFNSGSFFDDNEISKNARKEIYDRISELKKIKEVVIESRVEFITPNKLEEIEKTLKNKHVEIGIGLESVDDHVRNQYINKGLKLENFEEVVEECKQFKIGIRTYLLFKPPFLNEMSAIDDCSSSIRYCIDLGVNTISVNPINIQTGSLVEYLWYRNQYRPPWFYSLFTCLQNSINDADLERCRIVSDPSGAGTKRGIHNCLKRECNESMKNMLKSFVINQDITKLDFSSHECECKEIYNFQKCYD